MSQSSSHRPPASHPAGAPVRSRAAGAPWPTWLTWPPWHGLALPLRWLVVGGALCGGLGALVGLVLGLVAYPPTAWFAIIEVGLPAAVLGALLGVAAGSVAVRLKARG